MFHIGQVTNFFQFCAIPKELFTKLCLRAGGSSLPAPLALYFLEGRIWDGTKSSVPEQRKGCFLFAPMTGCYSVCWSLWMSWKKPSGRIIVRGQWPTRGPGDVPSALSPGEMQGPGSLVCWWQIDTWGERAIISKTPASTWDLGFEKSGKRIYFGSSLPVAFFILLNWHMSQGLESIRCGRSMIGVFLFLGFGVFSPHFFKALFCVRMLYSLQRHNSDLVKLCWCLWLQLQLKDGKGMNCLLRKQIFQAKSCRKSCELGTLN